MALVGIARGFSVAALTTTIAPIVALPAGAVLVSVSVALVPVGGSDEVICLLGMVANRSIVAADLTGGDPLVLGLEGSSASPGAFSIAAANLSLNTLVLPLYRRIAGSARTVVISLNNTSAVAVAKITVSAVWDDVGTGGGNGVGEVRGGGVEGGLSQGFVGGFASPGVPLGGVPGSK